MPSFRIYESGGRRWWVAWSASAYLARDGLFISTEALRRDVARRAGGSRGPLLVGHVPGLRVGECLFGYCAGRILVEAGAFDDTPLGRAAAEGLARYDGALSASVRWAGKGAGRTFHEVEIIERSILPAGREADITTQFSLVREIPDMDWLKVFASKLGLPAEEVEQAINDAERASAELDVAGVPSRADQAQDAEAPAPGEGARQDMGEAGAAAGASEDMSGEGEAMTREEMAELMAMATEAIIAGVSEAVVEAMNRQNQEVAATIDETERTLTARIDAVGREVNRPERARELFLAALNRRASEDPSTALAPGSQADAALLQGAVGTPAHPLDQFRSGA